MAKQCPITDGFALYLDCLECDERKHCAELSLRKEQIMMLKNKKSRLVEDGKGLQIDNSKATGKSVKELIDEMELSRLKEKGKKTKLL